MVFETLRGIDWKFGHRLLNCGCLWYGWRQAKDGEDKLNKDEARKNPAAVFIGSKYDVSLKMVIE